MKKKIYIIVATDINRGIGKNGKMPWNFKKEMDHFKKITLDVSDPSRKNMVIMGRTTWESIPEKFRPLRGRQNVVLTRNTETKFNHAFTATTLEQAINLAGDKTDKIFIIGGASVYANACKTLSLDGLYITEIQKSYDCDTYFPEIPKIFNHKEKLGQDKEDGVLFTYNLYLRK